MYKSKTFSDDLNIHNYRRTNINKIISISVLCCIEILTSSTLYCYSVILWKNSQSYSTQDKFFSYENGLWTVIIYLFCYGVADPWSKYLSESLEDNPHNLKTFRSIIFGATIILITNFYIFVLFKEEYYLFYNILYGLNCGVSTNIITAFIIGKIMEQHNVDTRSIEIFAQFSKSLSLLIMPNIVLYFTTFFNNNSSGIYFVYGSLLICILPFTLFIRNNRNNLKIINHIKSHDSTLQKTKDIPLKNVTQTLNSINEALDETYSSTSSDDYDIQEIQDDSYDNDNATNYWECAIKNDNKPSSGDDFNHYLTVAQLPQGNEVTEYSYKIPSMFVRNYYENAGVSILPSIPEEEESEDINLISLKRLSRISTVLEELNENQKMYKFPSTDSLLFSSLHSLQNCDNLNDCENNQSITNDFGNKPEEVDVGVVNKDEPLDEKSVLKQMKRKKCSCCSPYKKYKYRLKWRRFKYFLIDSFFKPFYISMKNIYFYPPLLTKSLNNLISTLLYTSIPFIITKTSKLPIYETTMLLSMIALSWSFSLTSVPIMKDCSITKIRALFISGLIMCGIALSLIHMKTMKISNDCFIIGSCMFGFGFGLINCWENVIYRRFIGIHKWNRVKGSLETMSATLDIIIYSVIYYFRMEDKLPMFISIASGTYFVNAILWIIFSILVKCLKFTKHCCIKDTNYLNDNS